ncbi:MAG: hypothetical protein WDN75_21320 [Bacteroidota bacterium]
MKEKIFFIATLLLITYSSQTKGQVRVDPLTGKPSMGIPVWTITSGDLAAPIGISYSGTPKVNDGEGTAGMGWNMNGGWRRNPGVARTA